VSKLWSWLKAILAWFAGRSAGEADANAEQMEATADAAQRITEAANDAPADNGALVERLRDGAGL
jgi:Ser/Thr protein kinase RdoA (MazF antagonist)